MRLFHPFAALLALANAAGIETKRDIHHFPTASVAQDKRYNTPVNTPPVTPSIISPATFSAGASSSASASTSASSSSTASSASSTTNTANDDDKTNPTCTTPSASGTNLLSNGDFSLADGSSWTITGNLTFLPGNWPSYGIDSVPSTSTSSSSSSGLSGDDEDGTANAFYANVRAPKRREVTLAQGFEAPPGGGKLYFGIELRASRAKPPASVGCEYYSGDRGEGAVEGLVDGPVPVPAGRGSWAQWGKVFDGGAEGTRQGVRCRIVAEEGDFDGNKDVTVFIRNVVVAGCD